MTETSQHSRRSLFRVAVALTPGPADAASQRVRPFGRHLAFGADPTKQVVISWQQRESVSGPYVRLATGGTFGPRIAAEVRKLKSEVKWQHFEYEYPPHGPTSFTQYYLHVKLADLKSNTTYYYVVGHKDYDPTTSGQPGEIASFRTAGSGPFSFTAFGDQGSGYNARKLNSQVADIAPAFHLALGNLSYAITKGTENAEGGNTATDEYDALRWNSYLSQNDVVAAHVPWMLTLGNREMEEWYAPNGYGGTKARFSMPDNAWNGSTGIYAWRYHNVGLISLDGNEICHRNTANFDYTKGKQLKWLDQQLGRFRADSSIEFIVVYLHHATYSTADAGGAETVAQQKWAPVFDKHKVDLVLNAHNRLYERTDPIRAGKAVKQVKPRGTVTAGDGTIYITAGGGGQHLDTFYQGAPESYLDHEDTTGTPTMKCFKKNSTSTTDTKVTWSRVRYRGYGLVAADVAPGRLTVRALDENGVMIDEITVKR